MNQQLPSKIAGIHMATNYMWRQHLRLLWLSALISGPMAAYSVNVHAWIPFIGFNLVSWGLLMVVQIASQLSLNNLFGIYVTHQREGKEPDPEVMKEINQHAWIHWAIALMLWYWMVVLIFASDLYDVS